MLMTWGLATSKESPEALEWIQEVVSRKGDELGHPGQGLDVRRCLLAGGPGHCADRLVELHAGGHFRDRLRRGPLASRGPGQKPEETTEKDVFLVVVKSTQNKMEKKKQTPDEVRQEAEDANGAENSDVEFRIPVAENDEGPGEEQTTMNTVKMSEMDATARADIRIIMH